MFYYLYCFLFAQQTAAGDDCADLCGERRNGIRFAFGQIFYGTARKVDVYFVAVLCVLSRSFAFENGQTYVDRVAEEYTREIARNDAGNPAGFYRYRRVFAAGTATEVLFGYDNVARLYLFYKRSIDVFHAMRGKRGRGRVVEIPCGYDLVGVYVVFLFMYKTAHN